MGWGSWGGLRQEPRVEVEKELGDEDEEVEE